MIQLNLTPEEIILLKGILDSCLEDLRVEIHAADNMAYKDMLKERKELLMKLMDALPKNQQVPTVE